VGFSGAHMYIKDHRLSATELLLEDDIKSTLFSYRKCEKQTLELIINKQLLGSDKPSTLGKSDIVCGLRKSVLAGLRVSL